MYTCTFAYTIYAFIYTCMYICLYYLYESDIIGLFKFLKINILIPCDFSVCISKKLRYKRAFLRSSYSRK